MKYSEWLVDNFGWSDPSLEQVFLYYGVPSMLWLFVFFALVYWGEKYKMFNRLGWWLGIKNPYWPRNISYLIFFIVYVYIFPKIYNPIWSFIFQK